MYYKQFAKRLAACGWYIIDESHEETINEPGRIYPHYFKYAHDDTTDYYNNIEICTANLKDGSPGRIVKLYQGGRPCRI